MPAIALLPAIIGASGAIGGGLLAKRASKNNAQAATQTTSQPTDPSIVALNNSLKGLADYQLQQGKAVLPQALSSLGASEDFNRTLLGGDRDAMMSLLGPQLNAIGQQGRSQQQSFAQLMPRGGYATDRLGSLSTNTQGQINDALLNYRPAAAQSLANIGGQYGSLASGLLGGSGASNSSALSALLSGRGQDLNAYLQKYGMQQENNRALGQGIGGLLSILLGPGGILNKGGSKGGSGNVGSILGQFPNTGGIFG